MLYVMLVGAYPFERPEDKTDTQKLQKMIQVTFWATLQQPWSHAAAVCMQQQWRRQRWQLVHQHNGSGSWSFHGDQQHITVVVAAHLGSALVVVLKLLVCVAPAAVGGAAAAAHPQG